MNWHSQIVDFNLGKALDGYDDMLVNGVMRRFGGGNPMMYIAIGQFKDAEKQLLNAESAKEWNAARGNFRQLLMTLLNNTFDSIDRPPVNGVLFVDSWLLQQGFGDGTIVGEEE